MVQNESSLKLEDESVLTETEVQKDFILFFKKSFNLVITDFRIVLMYYGSTLERGDESSSKIKRLVQTK